MRAITVLPSTPNSVELRDVPEPPRHEGAILVDAIALGVCGTDREIIAGDYGEAPAGHERLILGRYGDDDGAEAVANGNRMFQRHLAILGNSGAGISVIQTGRLYSDLYLLPLDAVTDLPSSARRTETSACASVPSVTACT